MEDQASLSITTPSISRSGSIATVGKSWGAVGFTGSASFELPLPTSAGRGFDPSLTLRYDSQSGNGPFGIGWGVNTSAITRQTSKGVPHYRSDDVMLGPDGEVLMPDLDGAGNIQSREETQYRGLAVGKHRVVRYQPRIESAFALIEFWQPENKPPFWLVHSAEGSLHVYGKSVASRREEPLNPDSPDAAPRIGVWLLLESINTHGEHICYDYIAEDQTLSPDSAHDYRAQRHLHRVCYGNVLAGADLYAWTVENPASLNWHFHLLFDYGERAGDWDKKPIYGPPWEPEDQLAPWLERSDPFHFYGYGFEIGTRRLCQQVLMFHHFPEELGPAPTLVRRLLLKYSPTAQGYNQLVCAHYQAYDASGAMEPLPPVQFDYSAFEINTQPSAFFPFDRMPGLEDGQRYQCVDLFGEGVPGFLCRYDQCWYYREPLRSESGGDHITYGPWTALSQIPLANRNSPALQILTDLTGDGRLDWIIAQPGLSGFHTLNPDRSWSGFIPFSAFPVEYFHTLAQLGDLTGNGLSSLALIGPRSVRLYANRREDGFAKGQDVPHEPDADRLPLFSNSRSELVLLGNMLGSDMSELCRIRHNEIKCWPNLGHGRFGRGFVMSALPFTYAKFDAERVRIADLDGSGAPALIYLNSDGFDIYFNRGGSGLEQTPVRVPWPEGMRYDNLCQVTFADLQGLGCSSLILSVPHIEPRHWRYDFVDTRPYLLNASNNNTGCNTQVTYRSSAQEWLDEKQQLFLHKTLATSYLPFPIQVVKEQSQLDEITGNRLVQSVSYAEGSYDGFEREFRGFGRLCQTDCETIESKDDIGFTAPARVYTWFHTGRQVDGPRDGYFNRDLEARPLGDTLFCRYHANDRIDEPRVPDETSAREIARALAGSVLRTELYGLDDSLSTLLPYQVQEYRYKVRELRAKDPHAPYAILMPSLLETISYQYERFIDDPLCQHEITLAQDEFGQPTHSLTLHYARRRTEDDTPPFDDTDEQGWWRDAHDPAQQSYYLSESRTEFIHLTDPQGWRLGLPYRQRGNALKLPKGSLPTGLNPEDISYERMVEHHNSAAWNEQRELTTQAVQRYLKTADRITPLADGSAEFEALAAPQEIAQLDETALNAYDALPAPFDIRAELAKIGYVPMPLFLEPDPAQDQKKNLWSARYGYAAYGGPANFYNVSEYHETQSHGTTQAVYDTYSLAITQVTLPDDCTTRVAHDYHALQPLRIIDANENIMEAIYEPSGQPLAISFYGTENGKAAGFRPLDEYIRPDNALPDPAIADPPAALQKAASVLRKDLFSWMGQLPESARQQPDWLAGWIAQGYVLPSLHICASARARLPRLKLRTPAEQTLKTLIATTPREPVHSVVLTADRYHDDPLRQIQIIKACVDGFGRALQTQQRVEPGMAFSADENLELEVVDGKPVEQLANPRWRISERVEYNNKGAVTRVFRPYFCNTHGYIRDQSVREFGYHDQQFYDPLGRPIKVISAKGYESFETLHPWYHASHDFNDTESSQASEVVEP
ncbi:MULTISPECIES: SpvB/TcaC N-terminal domain-containing protein [unclassified Pseudomonas]|uniref:SpvB/TcaC N-terminal domain-containing protein n=1 Tax=unclassified Pseudomonas TaxID=196821 RepID=UPI002AC9C873|nr:MULTISPECIES: SpvB/TcaC N-terminal domain-containing protein [unclassified Pseudomonas]MEB0045104.1 SpvB/TcaC N-terminal domain-containing protein [Pseudomonas sp. Dout3]MEB0095884.1 SpvB/TcaC N-terminal domain-containing protein [Pseudomonas sp. DC1.2]WPX57753.1 SpvB/TcaC N-terminal domain-containing protein [Pseudomonas sp. DC1.2]